jgi:hypothetical protein
MPDSTLDYDPIQSRTAWKVRIATSLNRISWILFVVSVLSILAIVHFAPRKSLDPWFHFCQKGSDLGPVLNIIGAGFGISSALLGGNGAVIATVLNIVVMLAWPSLGSS